MTTRLGSTASGFMAALAAICLTLAGAGRAAAQPVIPADYLGNLPRLWQAVMTGFYGPYDRQRKCWTARFTDEDGQRLHCMRPHKLDSAPFRSGRRHFLVVGGFRIGPEGHEEACFGCAGRLGLIVLGEQGGRLVLVAANSLHEPFGSYGTLPGDDDFVVRRLGPNDNFGWVVRHGVARMGTNYESDTLFGVAGSAIRQIGTFPAAFNDLAQCENGKNAISGDLCTTYRSTLRFDDTKTGAPFFPVALELAGSRNGALLSENYTVAFNPVAQRYDIPKELLSD